MASATMFEPPVSTPLVCVADEPLYEVVNGQRVELPPMSAYASWIASRLQSRLGPLTEVNQLGTVVTETLFILDAGRNLRRRPDLAFVSAQKWPLDRELPERGDWELVPDLAVEVISPSDLFSDVFAKMAEYFAVGVRQVWIVLPIEKQVHVYDSPTRVRILSGTEELDSGDLLPGFHVPVAALFKTQAQTGSAPA